MHLIPHVWLRAQGQQSQMDRATPAVGTATKRSTLGSDIDFHSQVSSSDNEGNKSCLPGEDLTGQ